MARIPSPTRESILRVLGDAVEEDDTLLPDLLLEILRRVTVVQAQAPLVLSRWTDLDAKYGVRYLGQIGGTLLSIVTEVIHRDSSGTYAAIVDNERGGRRVLGDYGTQQEARDAADRWAADEMGYPLA